MNTSDTQNSENTSRPFGYWLKAVDRLMAAEFATAFEGEHTSRRDWRILNIIDGSAPTPRPLNAHKLHRLVERGWVAPEGDGWTLTDDGRAAKERLGAIVDGIRTKISGAVSDEEMATTLASLEKIARAFGWDEETPLPRGRRHGFGGHGRGHGFPRGFGRGFGPGAGRGFGPGFGPGFGAERVSEHGHGRGFGPDAERGFEHGREHGFGPGTGRGFGPDADADHGCRHGGPDHRSHDRGHAHQGHGEHRHGRGERHAQHAFERGFDAGYSRGRDA